MAVRERSRLRMWLAGATVLAGMTLFAAAPAQAAPAQAARGTARAARSAATDVSAKKAATRDARAVCARPAPGHAACLSLVRTNVHGHRGVYASGQAPEGYGPSDLHSAYDLPATPGGDETVALVDAYGDPNAEADLQTYRAQYGLPVCDTADKCFKQVNQEGQQRHYPASNTSWAYEESLDIDMVSAICPHCHIILVEADSSDNADLYAAEDEAVKLGAKFVSNSWGESEFSGETEDDTYFDHPGVAITVSAGDDGYGVAYPAASPYVTSVGGTSLTQDPASPRGWTETAWDGTGSGCSAYEPKPSWQTDTGCANRTDNDVSAVADPDTGVAVYDSLGGDDGSGWLVFGGTSVASPIIASTYALAGKPVAGTYPASYPYVVEPAGLNDVTSGSNGTCSPAYLCTAGPGYDGPTGWGTPDGLTAFAGRPHGSLAGEVTDQATGAPVSGATVTAAPGYTATTDAAGDYSLSVPAGTYDVTAKVFGYKARTRHGVQVSRGQTTTENFALPAKPDVILSGTVTDGSGQGWPLQAEISIQGDPGGLVYSSPYTGQYSASLPAQTTYHLTVTPLYPGYHDKNLTVNLGAASQQENFTPTVVNWPCSAPGYAIPSGSIKCTPVSGGLVAGTVSDGNTGSRLDGATVTSVTDPAQTTTTADSPAGGDGFYWLFAAGTGSQQFTVTDPDNYSPGTVTVNVTPDAVTQQDVPLQAGQLAVSTGSVSATQTLGGSVTKNVTFTNTGTEPVQVGLVTQDTGPTAASHTPGARTGAARTAAAGAPLRLVRGHFSPAAAGHVTRVSRPDHSRPAADPAWQDITSFPTEIMDNAVAYDVATGEVYSIGGVIPNPNGTGEEVTASGYVYDPVTGQWSAITALPAAVHGASSAFIGSTLYLTGGWDSEGDPVDTTYAYDPSSGTWTELASLPTAVSQAGTAVVDGQLYVVGGCGGSSCQPAYSVYSYDPSSNTWTQHASYPPGPVAYASCAGLDGQLVCAGGIDAWAGNDTTYDSTWAYDPGSDTWTQRANMPYGDWGAAYAGGGGELEIVGGVIDDSAVITNQAAAYDPSSNTWSALPNAATATYRGGASCGLYSVGGSTGGSNLVATAELLPGYAQCGPAVPWLSASQQGLELAPGQSVRLPVTLDAAAVAQPGTYTAELAISTNTPYPYAPVTVTLQVSPPRDWGEITGTVTDAITGSPIAGATVQVCTMYEPKTGSCGAVAYTLTTDGDGSYQWWLDKGYNPLAVDAAADGYTPALKVVKISGGGVTTVNFALDAS